MPRDGELETAVTLLLADQAPALAEAHDELYPERVAEGIPLSLTLLYPFAPVALDLHLDRLRRFLASRPPFAFSLDRLVQWEWGAVYAAPAPEAELRGMMRELWREFPELPPYGRANHDPPPHASLTLSGGDDPFATLARVEERLEGLLPAHFEIREAALIQEYEPDRWRVAETFPFGHGQA